MGDAEDTLAPSKKRTAGRQITKENPGLDDDEDTSEQETGTFKKASDDILASRRIVKVRRQQPSAAPSAASNPFAGIRLVPPANLSAAHVAVAPVVESVKSVSDDIGEYNGVNLETEKGKDNSDKKSESKVEEAGTDTTLEVERPKSAGKVEGDEKLQSSAIEPETESMVSQGKDTTIGVTENLEPSDGKTDEVNETKNEAKTHTDEKKSENEEKNNGGGADVQKNEGTPFGSFQQLSSSQNAFTGVAGSGFSSSTFSFGPISKDGSTIDSGFSKSTLFSNLGTSVVNKGEGSGLMQEVTVETGEENEKAVFTADSVLFEFLDGGWKERGKGEIKVNVSSVGSGKARLVMRARGNYRLILNASLYPAMKLTAMDKKGITFACMNSNDEGKKGGLSTFALKFRDPSIAEEFGAVVAEHKGNNTTTGLKTPENSP